MDWNKAINRVIETSLPEIEKSLGDFPVILEMYKKNSVLVTEMLDELPDGRFFLFPSHSLPHAQWHRDATNSVLHLIPFAKDEEISKIIKGISHTQAMYVNIDPYVNSMKKSPEAGEGWNDKYPACAWVNERKYELDCHCAFMKLAYEYYKYTGDASIFTFEFKRALYTMFNVWENEQKHYERSNYRFERENCPETDTIVNEGKGNPVGYTGMVWSGFRASDDATTYGYHIADNMYLVSMIKSIAEILRDVYNDRDLALAFDKKALEIDAGIKEFGIYNHPKYGKIYAFEIDGLGNRLLRDDGFAPNLLSAPYYGYCSAEDEIYQNTVKFIFSEDNPMYSKGISGDGIGSIHEKIHPRVCNVSLVMRGLVASTKAEVEDVFRTIVAMDNGHLYMRESVNPNNNNDYSWDTFCWPSAMLCELIYKYSHGYWK